MVVHVSKKGRNFIMKNLFFGLIATVFFTTSSFANLAIFEKASTSIVKKDGDDDKLRFYICLYGKWLCVHFERLSMPIDDMENLDSKGSVENGQLIITLSQPLEGTFTVEKDASFVEGTTTYRVKAGLYSINGSSVSLPLTK